MQTVIIVIHLLVVIALVGVVLIQRSEGGGLGIGGGSGFMTARGAKNTLTRVTAILAACFFITSILLTAMQFVPSGTGAGIVNQVQKEQSESSNLIKSLEGAKTDKSSAPQSGAQKDEGQKPADKAGDKAKADTSGNTSQDDAHG